MSVNARPARRNVCVAGLLMVLVFVMADAALSQEAPKTLRVLCYNIHHGEGTDGRVDLERLATFIRSVDPDVVALQEVDNKTRRTSNVDQTTRLAELTGLHGQFCKQLDYEGGEYGQAVLSRFPVSPPSIHWLPGQPDRERRIAAEVTVDVGGLNLAFVTTHLHHANNEIRLQQAHAINELFSDRRGPTILAGDLNAQPDSEVMTVLNSRWSSATSNSEPATLTFPSVKPEKQLDYVLCHRGNEILRPTLSRVPDESVASDHRPLVVEFRISP